MRSVYAQHRPAKNAGLKLCDRKTVSQYFDTRLTELLLKDCACARRTREVCALDWDPFYDAQDFEEGDPAPRTRRVDDKGSVRLEVTIPSQKPVTLFYYFSKASRRAPAAKDATRQTVDDWRITDIRSAVNRWALREVLSKGR